MTDKSDSMSNNTISGIPELSVSDDIQHKMYVLKSEVLKSVKAEVLRKIKINTMDCGHLNNIELKLD